MKSKLSRSMFLLLVLLSIYGLLRLLNIVSFYSIGTVNMEPNLMVDEKVFATSLIKHDRRSIVAYDSKSLHPGPSGSILEGVFIGRIVAKGGDQLEIKDGYTYVNGKLTEGNTNLQFAYKTSPEFLEANQSHFENDYIVNKMMGKTTMIFIDDSKLKELKLQETLEKMDSDLDYNSIEFLKDKPKGWSALNYGPIEIPLGKYFIMGDNRCNSEDSRHKGFVNEDDILATIDE